MSGWYWQCKSLGVESKKKKKPLWTCVEDPVKFHGNTESSLFGRKELRHI